MLFYSATVFAAFAGIAEAHIALWHPSMFGLIGDKPQREPTSEDYQNKDAHDPLRKDMNLKVDKWFGHGYKAYPPLPGNFMELPSGGTFNAELQCERYNTTMGHPDNQDEVKNVKWACYDKPSGVATALHNMQNADDPIDDKYFGGTSLAIAYTSDVNALKPSDMTVISVHLHSPWLKDTPYHIPEGLPECPPEGCLCTWNWLHRAEYGEGYGDEMYNLLYRCKVTGKTNNSNKLPVGGGKAPKFCKDKPDECVKGPKQSIHVYQAEGNNAEKADFVGAATYTTQWGFPDGAQKDLFGSAGKKHFAAEKDFE